MKRVESSFDIPIVMLVFCRPVQTKIVLERILEMNPRKLYVIADGPRINRLDQDTRLVEETRSLFDNVPNSVEVKTLFRARNMGLKKSVKEGLDWFFNQESMGIIIEDDCLPSHSFFYFMKENLLKYRDVPSVMHIGGNNYQLGIHRGEKYADYYFSNTPHVWGWATWADAWSKYTDDPLKLKEFLEAGRLNDFGYDRFYRYKHRQYFRQTMIENTLSSWAYIWHFSIWYHRGVSISPNVNLVKNIGFGEQATHTTHGNGLIENLEAEEMHFPLRHPQNIRVDQDADNYDLGIVYGRNWSERIRRRLLKLFRK